MYDHGVDAAFVREMQEVGLAAATPDQLVEMYDHGVDAAFVREMRDLGFANLAPSEWVELRDHGVDSDFAREMHSQYPTRQGRWGEPGE
jgi:hypothetical protein